MNILQNFRSSCFKPAVFILSLLKLTAANAGSAVPDAPATAAGATGSVLTIGLSNRAEPVASSGAEPLLYKTPLVSSSEGLVEPAFSDCSCEGYSCSCSCSCGRQCC